MSDPAATEVWFIDANVAFYAAGRDHPLKRPCAALLEAVTRGTVMAATDVEVAQEILHRYTALGERARAVEAADLFMTIVGQVLPVTKLDMLLALRLHREHPAAQARDSLHAAVMQRNDLTAIVTADRHFDAFTGLRRIDPARWRRALRR